MLIGKRLGLGLLVLMILVMVFVNGHIMLRLFLIISILLFSGFFSGLLCLFFMLIMPWGFKMLLLYVFMLNMFSQILFVKLRLLNLASLISV